MERYCTIRFPFSFLDEGGLLKIENRIFSLILPAWSSSDS